MGGPALDAQQREELTRLAATIYTTEQRAHLAGHAARLARAGAVVLAPDMSPLMQGAREAAHCSALATATAALSQASPTAPRRARTAGQSTV